MELNKINNQQLLQELINRLNDSLISEKKVKNILDIRKEQRLSEYEAAANDPEEKKELKDWDKMETEDWNE